MQQAPVVVAAYAGQNQRQRIIVPARIAYRQVWEEGPWAMAPYASLYPQPAPTSVAYVPPPLATTDLFRAQQTWPL